MGISIKFKNGMDRALNRAYGVYSKGLVREERSLLTPFVENLKFTKELVLLVMLFSFSYPLPNLAVGKNKRPGERIVLNNATVYAANMDVILSFIIERQRNKRLSNSLINLPLKRAYRLANLYYPTKALEMEKLINRLFKEEASLNRNPEVMAGLLGEVFSEVFSFRQDEHEKDFRDFAYNLGKFIYYKSKYDTLKNDEKKGRHNPLIYVKKKDPEVFFTYIKLTLKTLYESCMGAFLRLPIKEKSDILRNVMYVGLWRDFEDM